MLRRLAVICILAAAPAVWAQQPAPPGMSAQDAASRRFPQPVRVESLLHRSVLEPRESQPTLGRVADVVRLVDGQVAVVLQYGGLFGWFTRPIAVPLTAMVLLGPYMEVVDYTKHQLDGFTTFDATGAAPLPRDSVIHVGLARPSH